MSAIKNSVLERFNFNKVNATDKENAVSYAESPITYNYDMFAVATDRINTIKEVNQLCGDNGDIRFQRANYLIAENATKGGFSVVVQGSDKDRQCKRKEGKEIKRITPGANYAQNVIDDFLKRTKLNVFCTEHAAALLREGDIFLNVIVDFQSGLVLQVKRAPVLTMKRNADQYGEFTDIERAFSQIDPITDMYAYMHANPPKNSRMDFALYQINHIRWLSDETKLYGRSQYAVARKAYKKIEEMEKALAYRRMYRSVSKRAHKLEQRTEPKDITEYKRANAIIDINGNPTKNAHLLSDFVGNVEVKSLNDEANLDQIKDIELMENLIWVNLLVPKAILTGGQNINRDVLKVQYPHYLQSLNNITDHLEYGDSFMYSGYRAIIDLQLMLAGINPDSIEYDMVWSLKTHDELIDRIETVQAALGKNGGKQIITIEKAIQLMANEFDIEDPKEMYEHLQVEARWNRQNALPDEKDYFQNSNAKNRQDEQEGITDDHAADESKMDELTESLKQDIGSFFDVVYDRMLNYKEDVVITDDDAPDSKVTFDEVEGRFNLVWEGALNQFIETYIDKLVSASALGKKRAKALVKEAQEKKYGSADASLLVKIKLEKPAIKTDLLKASGTRIKGIKKTTLNSIRNTLAEDFDSNIGWQGIMKKIAPIIKNYVRAEMIARTELSWAYTRNTLDCYTEAGVWYVVWDATLDMRVCKGCSELHGRIFFIHDLPDIPHHPRCRCTWLPYL